MCLGGAYMMINTNNVVSITEANQNFSRVARMVDEHGSAVILKNNTPRYLLIEFSQAEKEQTMPDEDVMTISRRIMANNRQAYEVLAK
jgi:antitoxin Phd